MPVRASRWYRASMWYQDIVLGSMSGGDHLHSGTVVGKLRWSKPPAVSELEIS